MDSGDVWMVLEEEEATFTCLARGASPAAELAGFLGEEEQMDDGPESTEGEGVWDTETEVSFIPSRADCGKVVRCVATQELFGEQVVEKQVRRRRWWRREWRPSTGGTG